jgi:pyruvate ferredoxin oxidoreductase beta subunit/2-oxoisovalerate ferredoxin oxidoreductase beta subunit
MKRSTSFRPKKTSDIPESEDLLQHGHLACPGCSAMPMYRLLLRVFGRKTVIVTPACCFAVIDGPFPFSASGVPLLHTAFEASAAYASGVRAGLDMRGEKDIQVVVFAGDGGTFDIGLQALSGAAERSENFVYICYDNEAYMNTDIQRSSATPKVAWTTTTPIDAPKNDPKKDLGAIMAAHRIPYFATATLAYPDDLFAKLEKAKHAGGFRMIHYLSPCPVGWKTDSRFMVTLSRLAVQSRVFPLYEVEGGERYHLSMNPDPIPVVDYLKIQGRFAHLSKENVEQIQKEVDHNWERLMRTINSGAHASAHRAARSLAICA